MTAVDYPALRRPRMNAGVSTNTSMLLWATGVSCLMFIGLPWGLLALPVIGLVHGIMAWLYKSDPQILNLYSMHEAVPNDLNPGLPSHGEVSISRPPGFGRGIAL